MKFFVSVFLLILGPFSVIQTVFGLNCYVVNTTTECQSERKEANESDERSSDHAFSKYFACVRQKMIQMQKDTPCEPGSVGCATLTSELIDGTQLLLKSCGKSESSVCKALKSMNNEAYKFNHFVTYSKCDFCLSDKCNNKAPKNESLLPPLPPADVHFPSPSSLSCHNTDLNNEHLFNCVETTSNVGISQDQYNRRIIDGCFRESISKENNKHCSKEGTACTTLVYELNDQTEFMMKFCDNSAHLICNKHKDAFDEMLHPMNFVKRSYCDSCSSDYCNNKTTSNEPAPTPSNKPAPTPSNKPAPPPRDKHSPEEKLYDSRSAISTFMPSVTAVFVPFFIIHLLL